MKSNSERFPCNHITYRLRNWQIVNKCVTWFSNTKDLNLLSSFASIYHSKVSFPSLHVASISWITFILNVEEMEQVFTVPILSAISVCCKLISFLVTILLLCLRLVMILFNSKCRLMWTHYLFYYFQSNIRNWLKLAHWIVYEFWWSHYKNTY